MEKLEVTRNADGQSIDSKTLILFWFSWLFLYMPEPFSIDAPTERGYIISILFNGVFDFSLIIFIFALGCLIGFVSIILKRIWLCGIQFILALYSFISLFLYFTFHLSINSYVFELLAETNTIETQGFLRTYLTAQSCIISFVFIAILVGVEVCLLLSLKKRLNTSKLLKYTISIIVILMLLELRFFTPQYAYSQVFYDKADRWIIRTALWNITKSYYQFSDIKEQTNRLLLSQETASIEGCSYLSKNIVIIIGESYNKHHSSLYGYPLETNPLLKDKKNLYVFNDVIAPYNVTTHSFKNFLSLASIGEERHWYEAPLFPRLFVLAGYNVVFYSNQFFPCKEKDHYNESSGFLTHPKVAYYCFDKVNEKWHQYDMDLVHQFETDRTALEKDSLNLIMFQLNGQHVPAKDKYPSDACYFTNKDINRADLSEDKRQVIAEYDNATRYNDAVVSEIIDIYKDKDAIIIYFADHGDEVYDYRDKIGRSFDFKEMGKDGYHCQFDVPFLICLTNEYKNNHKEIAKEIENSTNKPFMLDDLPHLLIKLAGIKTKWYNPRRCIIDQEYDINRKRIIYSTDKDYDKCISE